MNQYSELVARLRHRPPDPAVLRQQVNIVVQATGRFVDPDGLVTNQPLSAGPSTSRRRSGPSATPIPGP